MSQDSQVRAELVDSLIHLSFEESIYPKDAVFGAAYALLDRAFVHVDREGGRLLVTVRPKPGITLAAEAIAGEFENEALAQAWRREILRDNRALIESTSAQALGGAAGPPGLDDLLDEGLGDLGGAFDDPLGIAVSWEDKYGKGKAEEQAEQPAAEPEGADKEPSGGESAP